MNEPVTESGDPDKYIGQERPGYYQCDFCQYKVPWLQNLNDGLWAVCYWCLDRIYGGEEE